MANKMQSSPWLANGKIIGVYFNQDQTPQIWEVEGIALLIEERDKVGWAA